MIYIYKEHFKNEKKIIKSINSYVLRSKLKTICMQNFGLGCRIVANCLFVGLGPVDGVTSVQIFLRYPSPYLHYIKRNIDDDKFLINGVISSIVITDFIARLPTPC